MTPVLVADATGNRAELESATGRPVLVAGDRSEALRLAARARPGVAVVDVGLPPEGGVSLAGALERGGVRVILAAGDADPPLSEALHAGVRVILGPENEDLPRAIAAAERRDLLLSRSAAQLLPALGATAGPPFPELSVRERDVLRQLTVGDDPRSAARRLGLTVKTVRLHIAQILGKLGAADATEAGRMARAAGLTL